MIYFISVFRACEKYLAVGNGDLYRATTTTPERFSSSAWDFTTQTLYPWALGIGITLTNIFLLIGICHCVKPEGKHYFRTFCRADDPGSCIKRSITARSYSDTDNI